MLSLEKPFLAVLTDLHTNITFRGNPPQKKKLLRTPTLKNHERANRAHEKHGMDA